MIKNEKGGIDKVRFLTKEGMQKIHDQSLLFCRTRGYRWIMRKLSRCSATPGRTST